MKQQIIELKKKLLLVELPEGAINVKGFDYKLIGKLNDITEERFKQWVESFETHNGIEYKNYGNYGIKMLQTAKASFLSKLKANGIYFENKIPHYSHNLNAGNKESF